MQNLNSEKFISAMSPHSPSNLGKLTTQKASSSDADKGSAQKSTRKKSVSRVAANTANQLIDKAGPGVLPESAKRNSHFKQSAEISKQANIQTKLSSIIDAEKNQRLQKRKSWAKNNTERSKSPQNIVLAPGKNPGGYIKINEGNVRLLSSFGVKLLEQDEQTNSQKFLVRDEIKLFSSKNCLKNEMNADSVLDYITAAFASSPTLQERVNSSFIRVLADIKEYSIAKNTSYFLIKGFCQNLGSYVLGKIYSAVPELKNKVNTSIERAATSLIACEIYSDWSAKWVDSGDIEFDKRSSSVHSISENLKTLTAENFQNSRLAKEYGAKFMEGAFEQAEVQDLIDSVHEFRGKLPRGRLENPDADQPSKTALREKSPRDEDSSSGDNGLIPRTRTYNGFLSTNFDRFPIQYGVALGRGRVASVEKQILALVAKIEATIKARCPELYSQAAEEMRDSPVMNRGGIFGAYALRYNYPTAPHKDAGVTSQSCLVCLVNDTELPTAYDFGNIDEAEQIVLKTGDILFAPHGELVHGNGSSTYESNPDPSAEQPRRMVLVLYSKPLPKIFCRQPNIDYDSDFDHKKKNYAHGFKDLRNISPKDPITKMKNSETTLCGREILNLDIDLRKTLKVLNHFQERQKIAKLFIEKDPVLSKLLVKINSFLNEMPEKYKNTKADTKKDFDLAQSFITSINSGQYKFGGEKAHKDKLKLTFQALERLTDAVDSKQRPAVAELPKVTTASLLPNDVQQSLLPNEVQQLCLLDGFYWYNPPPDGNCLFHVLARQFPGLGNHMEIRAQVADAALGMEHMDPGFGQAFAEEVSQLGEYTGVADTAIHVAAEAFRIRIAVIVEDGSLRIFGPDKSPHLMVLARNRDHFFLMERFSPGSTAPLFGNQNPSPRFDSVGLSPSGSGTRISRAAEDGVDKAESKRPRKGN